MTTVSTTPGLGIALGGGSARGWAHIGVLSALSRSGIHPEIICGSSIGALVGGIHAAGRLADLEAWVGALTRRDVLGLMDFTVGGGGMIGGRKLMELYREHLDDVAIEELPVSFAAVATDLRTGGEVWLREGSLLEAIRASISIPGIFTPVLHGGRWLVDGGLSNPVPVSLCRALGAERVIAVSLQTGPPLGLHPEVAPAEPAPAEGPPAEGAPAEGEREPGPGGLAGILARYWGADVDGGGDGMAVPGVASVIASSLDIVQARISRSRLAGDPPDVLLTPRVQHVPALEFAGGQATIDEGYEVVRRMMPALDDLLDLDRTGGGGANLRRG